MPAKTKKMQKFMGLCAHNPGAAHGKCPPRAVAEEFAHKPKGGYRRKKRRMGVRKDANGFY